MKTFRVFTVLGIALSMLSVDFCKISAKQNQEVNKSKYIDALRGYRKMIVGKFNGMDVDTLYCEPVGKPVNDELFGEMYFEWRIFSKKGTVKEFKVGNTIGIEFVKEGDLDGNGTDEWGYLTMWPTSSWTTYNVFTYQDGKWKTLIDPINIWADHLEEKFTESDIVQRSNKKGYVKVKTSTVNKDVTEWKVVNKNVKISPKVYTYKLVKW